MVPSTLTRPAPLRSAPPSYPTRKAPIRVAAASNPVLVRQWLTLAVGSLVIAGLLSLAVVVGRLPMLSGIINDPLFFKRCLVVHVDLALVVWFYAFIACLIASVAQQNHGQWRQITVVAATAGVFVMLAGALVRGAEPVLANYIPVIDHPLFLGGLALFFGGIVGFKLSVLFSPNAAVETPLPQTTWVGLQTSAVAIVLALVTWMAATAGMPAGVDVWTQHEFSNWGPGHVLQVANVAAMLAVWLWLLERGTGGSVLSVRTARILFLILLLPHFAMPVLTAKGTLNTLYHSGATWLMRWTLFPVLLTMIWLGCRHLIRSRGGIISVSGKTAITGFLASLGLTAFGIVLGACIRSSTTLIPAHYHASLGGVTVAFMTAAYLVVDVHQKRHRITESVWRSARRQIATFGIGQAVFVLGFAVGGIYGLGRKTYGTEQHVRSSGEYAGLIIMGLGGLIAVAGGLWFLFLILREIRLWWKQPDLNSA